MIPLSIGSSLTNLKHFAIQPALQVLNELLVDPVRRGLIVKPGRFQRNRLWTLPVTLVTYLAQCLSEDHSCRTAVARAKLEGWVPSDSSPDTTAYCCARDGLRAEGLQLAVEDTGRGLDGRVRSGDLWLGRVVRVADGSGISLSDTPENQKEFPQPKSQAPGCGFPMMYVVALMSLATGAAIRYVTSRLGVNEQMLFHRLHEFLKAGEIVLGDRAFGSFGAIAWLKSLQVDSVFRLSSRRKTDFRRGRRLGKGDHIVEWVRSSWPKWLEPNQPLVETMRLREVRFWATQRGFRSREITLVTTLLDSTIYSRAELASLYRRRWGMELWLRDIKTTMGMDKLRSETPDRVRAELAMFLLGYNAVRAAMLDAAQQHGRPIDRISFKSALIRIHLWSLRRGGLLAFARDLSGYEAVLRDLARDANPNRPDRIEPRAIKRKKKQYDFLNRPRAELRARLLRA